MNILERTRRCVLCMAGMCVLFCPGPNASAAGPRHKRDVTVDISKRYQQVAGFGGSEAYYEPWLAKHPNRAQILDALFGPGDGLHIDFLRLQNRYRAGKLVSGDSVTEIVRAANALRTEPLTIVMTSWSPPAELKSNSSEKNGGTLIQHDGHYDYAGFAQYWLDAVRAYRAVGISPTYVGIQNEPDWTVDYESCRFNPTEAPFHGESYASYYEAAAAVHKAFQQLPSPPYLIGPETIGIGGDILKGFLAAAANDTDIYAAAHHLYTGGDKSEPLTYVPALEAVKDETAGKLRFQTEYYTATGYDTALMMQETLVSESASMYLYWALTWPKGNQTLVTLEDPARQSEWKTKNGWALTDSYYAFKQFSYFVRPYYTRVDVRAKNDGIQAAAFVSPAQDKLVLVMINTSATQQQKQTVDFTGFHAKFSVVYRTTFSNQTERFANLGPMDHDTIMLPPHAVATVELTR